MADCCHAHDEMSVAGSRSAVQQCVLGADSRIRERDLHTLLDRAQHGPMSLQHSGHACLSTTLACRGLASAGARSAARAASPRASGHCRSRPCISAAEARMKLASGCSACAIAPERRPEA